MNEEIEFRPLRVEEAEAVAELAARVWRAHYPGIIGRAQIEYMLAQRYRPVLVRQFIARGDLWLAAFHDGALLAFAHGHPLSAGDYKLDKLYVDQAWQRRGIGGTLMHQVGRRARQLGYTRLVLRVNRQNQQAITAYLKHGFSVVTVHLEDIGQGFIMDDYVMTKELT